MAKLKDEEIQQIVNIAEMHYLKQISQKEIAEELNISKSKVCRYMKSGIELGIVKISVVNPLEKRFSLEDFFKSRFGLRDVIIVEDQPLQQRGNWDHVGMAASQYLKKILRDGDVVGLQWGRTGSAIARTLEELPQQDLKIVQIMGTTFCSQKDMEETFLQYSQKLRADVFRVPLPVILQTQEIRDVIMRDDRIREAMEWYKRCSVIVVTAAPVGKRSTSYIEKFVDEDEVRLLEECGAIGDMCGRFINLQGEICCPELDKRTNGISLDLIAQNKNAVLVGCGEEKVLPLIAGLNGGYGSVLITDHATAEHIHQILTH